MHTPTNAQKIKDHTLNTSLYSTRCKCRVQKSTVAGAHDAALLRDLLCTMFTIFVCYQLVWWNTVYLSTFFSARLQCSYSVAGSAAIKQPRHPSVQLIHSLGRNGASTLPDVRLPFLHVAECPYFLALFFIVLFIHIIFFLQAHCLTKC